MHRWPARLRPADRRANTDPDSYSDGHTDEPNTDADGYPHDPVADPELAHTDPDTNGEALDLRDGSVSVWVP